MTFNQKTNMSGMKNSMKYRPSFKAMLNNIREQEINKYRTSYDYCGCDKFSKLDAKFSNIGSSQRTMHDGCAHINYIWSIMTIEQRCGYYNTTRWNCNCAAVEYTPTKICKHIKHLRSLVPDSIMAPPAGQIPSPIFIRKGLEKAQEIHPAPGVLRRSTAFYPVNSGFYFFGEDA
jgi:hypothetical protein